MPELPEVEVLVQHLRPLLQNRRIRNASVRRAKSVHPTSVEVFEATLKGARIQGVERRAKYLVFQLKPRGFRKTIILLGHLGMTGRMYIQGRRTPFPKHTAVVLDLGCDVFVFEDTRYFGRMTLEARPLAQLGTEPLSKHFNAQAFGQALKRSRQPIKVKLLDQRLVAGLGNIYASEALFRAGISPRKPARSLNIRQIQALTAAIKRVLSEAIRFGSTVLLNFAGERDRDGLFYFGKRRITPRNYSERLRVYDRAGQACPRCGTVIKRIVQAARSTYLCPECQRH